MIILQDSWDYKPDDTTAAAMIRFPWSQLANIGVAASRSRFSTGSAAVCFDASNMQYYLSADQLDTTLYAGFAVYENSSRLRDMRINFDTDGGSKIQTYFIMTYTSTRAIQAFLGNNVSIINSAPNILPIDGWHYLEFKVFLSTNAASGIVEARLNGVVVLTATAKTDNNSTIHFYDHISVPNLGGAGITNTLNTSPAIDDFYLLNTSGGVNTTYLGDVHISVFVPTASGAYTQFTPIGAANNWDTVEEVPASTAEYITTSSSGIKDSYKFQQLPDSISNVFSVEAINYAEKTGGQLRTLAPIVVSGITVATGIAKALPQNSYIYQGQIYQTNPIDNSSWTPSGVNALEFGVVTS